MKRKKSDREKDCCYSESIEEQYPWGLKLNLDTEELEKLGIKEAPEVGEEVLIYAKAYIKDVSQNEREGEDGKRLHVGYQITDLEIGPVKNMDDAAEKMFGDK